MAQNFSLQKFYSDLQRVQSSLGKPKTQSKVKRDYSNPSLLKDTTHQNNNTTNNNRSTSVYLSNKTTAKHYESTSSYFGQKSKVNKISIQNRNINDRPSFNRSANTNFYQNKEQKVTGKIASTYNGNFNMQSKMQQNYSPIQNSPIQKQIIKEGFGLGKNLNLDTHYNLEQRKPSEHLNRSQQKQKRVAGQQWEMISQVNEKEFLQLCERLYGVDMSGEASEQSVVKKLLIQINSRDSIFELVAQYFGLGGVQVPTEQIAKRLEEFFRKQRMMIEIIEEFKKGSSLDGEEFKDYNALYYFLKGNKLSESCLQEQLQ